MPFNTTPLHKNWLEYWSGHITWEQYLDNLLDLCVQNNDDPSDRDLENVRFQDPFSYMTASWCKKIYPIEEPQVQAVKAVFKTYRQDTANEPRFGSVEEVEDKLVLLERSGLPEEGILGVKKPLAWRACYDKQAKMLEFLLERGGFPIEWPLLDKTKWFLNSSQDPEMTKVVSESRVLKQARDHMPPKQIEDMSPAEIFDEGGPLPVKW
ncbi:unnamed protein product [Cercospora beticola]|nr:unnamed protein product [Cercospora beticola]